MTELVYLGMVDVEDAHLEKQLLEEEEDTESNLEPDS
jgi:hypothetical protein